MGYFHPHLNPLPSRERKNSGDSVFPSRERKSIDIAKGVIIERELGFTQLALKPRRASPGGLALSFHSA